MTHRAIPAIKIRTLALWALTAAALAGCGALPDKPQRPIPYDLGPLATVNTAAPAPGTTPLAVDEVDSAADLDRRLMYYRLAYADSGQQLRPYSHARWSMSAPNLVGQRLRLALAATRPVVEPESNLAPLRLRTELEEFTHEFSSPGASEGVVQLRATVTSYGGRQSARVVAQRSFTSRKPAPSPDAVGGAAALRAATDDVVQQVVGWVNGLPVPAAR